MARSRRWPVSTPARVLHDGGGDPGVSAIAYFEAGTRDGALVFLSGESDAPLALQVIDAVDP